MEIVRTFSPAYTGEPNIPKIKIIKQVNPITLIRFFITLLPNRLNIQKLPFLNTVKIDEKKPPDNAHRCRKTENPTSQLRNGASDLIHNNLSVWSPVLFLQ